jgi:hypothetical protein
MVLRPGGCGVYYLAHWSYVGSGAPWQHTDDWQPPTEPTPTEPDRIAALEQRVEELGRLIARLSLSTADAFGSLRARQ